MKAAIFDKPGIENLKIKHDVEQPKITDYGVLIRVKMAGVNPFDHVTISGTQEIKPLPHIPGAETSGEIEKVGEHVTRLKEGDRVIVYNRIFDGTCDMCLTNKQATSERNQAPINVGVKTHIHSSNCDLFGIELVA